MQPIRLIYGFIGEMGEPLEADMDWMWRDSGTNDTYLQRSCRFTVTYDAQTDTYHAGPNEKTSHEYITNPDLAIGLFINAQLVEGPAPRLSIPFDKEVGVEFLIDDNAYIEIDGELRRFGRRDAIPETKCPDRVEIE